jgi:hypothetical protein
VLVQPEPGSRRDAPKVVIRQLAIGKVRPAMGQIDDAQWLRLAGPRRCRPGGLGRPGPGFRGSDRPELPAALPGWDRFEGGGRRPFRRCGDACGFGVDGPGRRPGRCPKSGSDRRLGLWEWPLAGCRPPRGLAPRPDGWPRQARWRTRRAARGRRRIPGSRATEPGPLAGLPSLPIRPRGDGRLPRWRAHPPARGGRCVTTGVTRAP